MAVDAVIPWVNFDDPVWQNKYVHFKNAELGPGSFTNGATATRFREVGELNRCLKSIETNAPWFRKIVILTDDQMPECRALSDETRNKIRIVSHADIFGSYRKFLPTFNSLVFECMLWNIESLSERFVYFNDDLFLPQPVTYGDFFDGNCIVIRGNWARMERSVLSRLRRRLVAFRKHSTGFREGQRKAAEMLGFNDEFFKFSHAPKAAMKSEMKSVFDGFHQEIVKTMAFRFRHPMQFSFLALYFHSTLMQGKAKLEQTACTVDIKGSRPFKRELALLRKSLKDPSVQFLCLQSLDLFTEEQASRLLSELDRHLASDHAPPPTGA